MLALIELLYPRYRYLFVSGMRASVEAAAVSTGTGVAVGGAVKTRLPSFVRVTTTGSVLPSSPSSFVLFTNARTVSSALIEAVFALATVSVVS